jgi:hypothetical protein
MIIMKKSQKIGISLITIVIILVIFPRTAVSQTTIGNSNVSVEKDDVITWKCTYCAAGYEGSACCEGSTYEVDIVDVYQGSYSSISFALIIDVIAVSRCHENMSQTNYPYFLVYNESLNFIDFEVNAYIIPIPIDFTLIAEFFEGYGYTCQIDGNKVTMVHSQVTWEHTYNSDGILTKQEWIVDGDLKMRVILQGEGGGGGDIPFGNYYILFTIVGIISIVAISLRKVILAPK